MTMVARDQLRSFIERIERLDEEIRELNADKSDIYKEAKGQGFDVKTMRKVISARKLDNDERNEQDALFETYMQALGMLPDFEEPSRTRAHARENIEEFPPHDAETGEIDEDEESPCKAAEAVSERTATQSLANVPCDAVTERSARVASETGAAEAGVSGQPETIPALTGQFPGANVSGPERAGVTAGETATHSEPGDDAIAAVNATGGLANVADVEPSSPAHRWSRLRPHCQNPDACAGSGPNHCHGCRQAMKQAEEAA